MEFHFFPDKRRERNISAARARMPENLEFNNEKPTMLPGLSKEQSKDRSSLRDCVHLAAKPRVM